jgi:flagellar motor component MotA
MVENQINSPPQLLKSLKSLFKKETKMKYATYVKRVKHLTDKECCEALCMIDEQVNKIHEQQSIPRTLESMKSCTKKLEPFWKQQKMFTDRIKELTGIKAGTWYWQPHWADQKEKYIKEQLGSLKQGN